jgi:putative transposase
MRRSRYTEEQFAGILKEPEVGMPAAELRRKHGISEQTFCRWKAEVRWPGSEGGAAIPVAGNGELRAEAVGRRASSGHRCLQGVLSRKWLAPRRHVKPSRYFAPQRNALNLKAVGNWMRCGRW